MSKYIEIKTLEISGFGAALQALRLPFGNECRYSLINAFAESISKERHIAYRIGESFANGSMNFHYQKNL